MLLLSNLRASTTKNIIKGSKMYHRPKSTNLLLATNSTIIKKNSWNMHRYAFKVIVWYDFIINKQILLIIILFNFLNTVFQKHKKINWIKLFGYCHIAFFRCLWVSMKNSFWFFVFFWKRDFPHGKVDWWIISTDCCII